MSIEENGLELELNPNDASFDARQIPTEKGVIRRGLAGLLAAITLFSGSVLGTTQAHATEITESYAVTETTNISKDTIIEIPEAYQYEVYDLCDKEFGQSITIGDLNNATNSFLSLSVNDNQSLEWLNYLNNVENLSIAIHTDDTSAFKDVTKLLGVTSLSLTTLNQVDLTKEDFAFLKASKDIKDLSIYGLTVEPGLLEELTNLNSLRLANGDTLGVSGVDFSKLTFLDELDFPMNGPYDIAMSLTSDAYKCLQESGVKITLENSEDLNKLLEINGRLDNIVDSLGVTEKNTDIEKLDAVLVYVLENLQYDESVRDMIIKNNLDNDYLNTFYEDGALYGALEKNTAICGNYAFLTRALLDRLGVENYYLSSIDHAWNLVEVEGEHYYVDSTWLDGKGIQISTNSTEVDEDGKTWQVTSFSTMSAEEAIKNGRATELDWYMEDPTNYPASEKNQESHEAENLPSFIQIKPIKDKDASQIEYTEPEEIAIQEKGEVKEEQVKEEESLKITEDDKFAITAGGKEWIIGGGAAIGIMAGLGIALAIGHKKKEEARRCRMSQNSYSNTDLNDFFQDNPYGNNSSIGRSGPSRRR